MRSLFWATGFLTVFPIGAAGEGPPPPMSGVARWFPVVGLSIGVVTGVALYLATMIMEPIAASLIALAIYATATRMLHLDGLADTVDGLLGGRDIESRLRIMRDSSIGTFGATALFFALAVKLMGFHYAGHVAGADWHIMPSLVYIPVITITGRWAMVCHASFYPYARQGEGTARLFCNTLKPRDALLSGIFPALACVGMLGLHGAVMLAAGMLFSMGAGTVFARAIRGATGDTVGACGEIAEAGCAIALMILTHLQVSPHLWFI